MLTTSTGALQYGQWVGAGSGFFTRAVARREGFQGVFAALVIAHLLDVIRIVMPMPSCTNCAMPSSISVVIWNCDSPSGTTMLACRMGRLNRLSGSFMAMRTGTSVAEQSGFDFVTRTVGFPVA
ncbi:hypothetical protein D9M70_428170 [compost metagenome]